MLLAAEIVVFVFGLSRVGMAMAQSIFQVGPLLVTMLSVPFLGEQVGWRRWTAIVVGLFGVLLIIDPTHVHFDWNLLFPLTATTMFAIYVIATRAVSKYDSAMTSFFYTGIGGAVVLTAVGLFHLEPIALTIGRGWQPSAPAALQAITASFGPMTFSKRVKYSPHILTARHRRFHCRPRVP